MRRNILLLTVTLAALAAVVAVAGCGDDRCAGSACGVSPDGGSSQGVFLLRQVRFVPDEEATAGDLRLELGTVDPGRNAFSLKIVGEGLTAFGVAGRLAFDSGLARVEGAVAGGALAPDRARVVAATAPSAEGAMFGFSRAGVRSGVRLSPQKSVGEIWFTPLRNGTTRITWVEPRSQVLGGDLQPVPTRFVGGTLTVE